jgi:sirohydrochlorin ferrochelatase
VTRLVLAAHGSADPGHAQVVEAIAARVRSLRPGLDVVAAFLDHDEPRLAALDTAGAVVVPLLLSGGFHATVDIPAAAPDATITAAVGPDALLSEALADRLAAAGYRGGDAVVLAAAGSKAESALDDVRRAAALLADQLGADVTAAFVSAGAPRVADLRPRVVASYLLSPGAFHDALLQLGADVVSAPLGDHPALAAVALARYDAAQVPGRTAPA